MVSIPTALFQKTLTNILPMVSASYLVTLKVAFIYIEYISSMLHFGKVIKTAFTPGGIVGSVVFVFD